MIALLQRVQYARVTVDNNVIGEIKQGLLILLGIEKDDDESKAKRLVERFLAYRIFSDQSGKMNLCVKDINGGVLLVPQFTLAADTTRGNRPSFSRAAAPEHGKPLFDYVVSQARQQHTIVETGEFGADMKVELLNDGPVTFSLTI